METSQKQISLARIANKKYIILLTGILLLIGFIASSFVSYYTTSNLYKKDLTESILPLTGDNIYSEIRKDLIELVLISSLMANDTFLRDWILDGEKDITLIKKYLTTVQEKYNTVTCFFASEKTGSYYHPTGLFTTISKDNPRDAWYYRIRDSKDPYNINLGIDNANRNSMTIFINYKVFDYNGNFLGITGCGLTVHHLHVLLDQYATRYNRIVYFVNETGEVTLASEFSAPSFSSIQEIPPLRNISLSTETPTPQSLSYQRDNETYLLNTRFIPELKLFLFVEQSIKGANRRNTSHLLLKNFLIALVIGFVIIAAIYSTVGSYQHELETLATIDKLTGACNRNAFSIIFSQTIKEFSRNGKPFTVILFDIDYFKKINDNYGHPAGDTVLAAVASCAREKIREADCLCRWGGEEFLLLLKDCDSHAGGLIAEELRKKVEDTPVYYHHYSPVHVQISLGVAEWHKNENEQELLLRVDKALYRAKNEGRNRVISAEDEA